MPSIHGVPFFPHTVLWISATQVTRHRTLGTANMQGVISVFQWTPEHHCAVYFRLFVTFYVNVATTLLTVASDNNIFVCDWWIDLGSFKSKCAGAFHFLPNVMIYHMRPDTRLQNCVFPFFVLENLFLYVTVSGMNSIHFWNGTSKSKVQQSFDWRKGTLAQNQCHHYCTCFMITFLSKP